MNWALSALFSLVFLIPQGLYAARPTTLPKKVVIFTSDEGWMSSIYSGVKVFLDPQYSNQSHSSRSGNLNATNAHRVGQILDDILAKGYLIDVYVDSGTSQFLKVYEDPSTVLIIHEGHGSLNPNNDKVAIKFGEDLLEKTAIEYYQRFFSREKIRPSPQLQTIYTQACYGGFCRSYYQDKLNLHNRIQWLGHDREVSRENVSELFPQLEDVVEQLPKLRGQGQLKVFHNVDPIAEMLLQDPRATIDFLFREKLDHHPQLKDSLVMGLKDRPHRAAIKRYFYEQATKYLRSDSSIDRISLVVSISLSKDYPQLVDQFIVPLIKTNSLNYYFASFWENYLDSPALKKWIGMSIEWDHQHVGLAQFFKKHPELMKDYRKEISWLKKNGGSYVENILKEAKTFCDRVASGES